MKSPLSFAQQFFDFRFDVHHHIMLFVQMVPDFVQPFPGFHRSFFPFFKHDGLIGQLEILDEVGLVRFVHVDDFKFDRSVCRLQLKTKAQRFTGDVLKKIAGMATYRPVKIVYDDFVSGCLSRMNNTQNQKEKQHGKNRNYTFHGITAFVVF
jgi:hypothetical protein